MLEDLLDRLLLRPEIAKARRDWRAKNARERTRADRTPVGASGQTGQR